MRYNSRPPHPRSDFRLSHLSLRFPRHSWPILTPKRLRPLLGARGLRPGVSRESALRPSSLPVFTTGHVLSAATPGREVPLRVHKPPRTFFDSSTPPSYARHRLPPTKPCVRLSSYQKSRGGSSSQPTRLTSSLRNNHFHDAHLGQHFPLACKILA